MSGLVLAAALVLFAGYGALAGRDGDDSSGSFLSSLQGDSDSGTDKIDDSTNEPGDALEESVPMETVETLFDLIEAAGYEPVPDETYSVEYVGDTEHIQVSGTFADGEDRVLEFTIDDEQVWQLED